MKIGNWNCELMRMEITGPGLGQASITGREREDG